MTFWAILNVLASLVVAAIVAFKLCKWPEKFTSMERFGMAMVGAGSLMTVGPIMSLGPTPFEDWSATLLRLGCATYFIGRMFRHRHNNAAAVRQARRHLGTKP